LINHLVLTSGSQGHIQPHRFLHLLRVIDAKCLIWFPEFLASEELNELLRSLNHIDQFEFGWHKAIKMVAKSNAGIFSHLLFPSTNIYLNTVFARCKSIAQNKHIHAVASARGGGYTLWIL